MYLTSLKYLNVKDLKRPVQLENFLFNPFTTGYTQLRRGFVTNEILHTDTTQLHAGETRLHASETRLRAVRQGITNLEC